MSRAHCISIGNISLAWSHDISWYIRLHDGMIKLFLFKMTMYIQWEVITYLCCDFMHDSKQIRHKSGRDFGKYVSCLTAIGLSSGYLLLAGLAFQLQQCIGASSMLATHSSSFNCRHTFGMRLRSTISSLSSTIQYLQPTSWPQMRLARMGEPCIDARDMCRKEKLPQSRMTLIVASSGAYSQLWAPVDMKLKGSLLVVWIHLNSMTLSLKMWYVLPSLITAALKSMRVQLPLMNPWPQPRSVLLLDNCCIHKSQLVEDAVRGLGPDHHLLVGQAGKYDCVH